MSEKDILGDVIGDALEYLFNPDPEMKMEEIATMNFMKRLVNKNTEFYAVCDLCNEKFYVVNIKNRSKFKCPTCNSDFEFDRVKMKFFRIEVNSRAI